MYLPRKSRSLTGLPSPSCTVNGPPGGGAAASPLDQTKAPEPSSSTTLSRARTPRMAADGPVPRCRAPAGRDIGGVARRAPDQSSAIGSDIFHPVQFCEEDWPACRCVARHSRDFLHSHQSVMPADRPTDDGNLARTVSLVTVCRSKLNKIIGETTCSLAVGELRRCCLQASWSTRCPCRRRPPIQRSTHC